MIIDLIVIGVSVIAFYRGWKKGLLWAITSMAAVILGSLISLKMSHVLAAYLTDNNIINSQYTLIASYAIIFIAVILVLRTGIKFVEKILDKIFLGWINNLSGALLYVLFSIFILSSILLMGNKVGIWTEESITESNLYPIVEPVANWGFDQGSKATPFLKDLFDGVNEHLDKVKEEQMPQA